MTITQLNALITTARRSLAQYRGGLRRLRPVTLDTHADQRLADATEQNDALRLLLRNPLERQRLRNEVRGEAEAARRLATAAARTLAVRAVAEAVEAGLRFEAAHRSDVSLSLPEALRGLTPDGLVSLELLRVHLAGQLASAPAATLRATYESAFARRDARAFLEMSIIEGLADTRQPLATTPGDREAARQLRDLIDGVRELRLPTRPPQWSDLPDELARLHHRADLLRVHPADPAERPEVQAALDAEQQAMTEAGAADDATDQAALRESLAGGGQ